MKKIRAEENTGPFYFKASAKTTRAVSSRGLEEKLSAETPLWYSLPWDRQGISELAGRHPSEHGHETGDTTLVSQVRHWFCLHWRQPPISYPHHWKLCLLINNDYINYSGKMHRFVSGVSEAVPKAMSLVAAHSSPHPGQREGGRCVVTPQGYYPPEPSTHHRRGHPGGRHPWWWSWEVSWGSQSHPPLREFPVHQLWSPLQVTALLGSCLRRATYRAALAAGKQTNWKD